MGTRPVADMDAPIELAEPPTTPIPAPPPVTRTTGSLSRRMILIAAAWILLLLTGGGYALDQVLRAAVTRNFDDQLDYVLTSLIVSAEIGPEGEVINNREPADQRFLEPYSGLYWQVSAKQGEPYRSRSLWDRRLAYGSDHTALGVHAYDSDLFVNRGQAGATASSREKLQ